MSSSFPRQDIFEKDKNKKWCKQVLDYAISVLNDQGNGRRLKKMQGLRNSYNGILDTTKIKYLTNTYGQRVKTRFIHYRLGRPKIDLINGEFLKRKLNSEIRSENRGAKAKKLEKLYTSIGMRETRAEMEKLRDIVGFNDFEGMNIPEQSTDDKRSKFNIKTRNEIFMSHVLKNYQREKNLKSKLAKNFMDIEQVSECHGRVYIKSDRTVHYETIRPEDAIFVESYSDDSCYTSPIRGHRKWMYVHDILNEYKLTKDERDKIDSMRGQGSTLVNETYNRRKFYRMIGDELSIEVIRVEWMSSRPVHTKEFSDGRKVDLSPEAFEKNKSKINNDVKNGKFKLTTRWKVEPWEATQIGHDIQINCQRLQNQMRSVDSPYDPSSTYISLLFNTVDGVRVSLQELLDNISFLYDVTMFQINRELAKNKGKVIAYDEAYLPRNKKMKDVLHNLSDDAIYVYNSSQDGNKIGRDVTVQGQIREIDLGLSANFQQLIATKLDLQAMADRLSGVNESREGQIAASATATNAQSSIIASRTITEPMFYFMDRFAEEVMTKILESYKVTIGVMGSKELDLILGDEGVTFFKATRDISNDNYGAYILDSRQEELIREAMDVMAQVSVNSKELRVKDWLQVKLSETLAEAEEALDKGWKEVEESRLQRDKIRAESNNQKLKTQIEMARENREDVQEHETNLELIKQGSKGMLKNMEGQNQLLNEQNKLEQGPESSPQRR